MYVWMVMLGLIWLIVGLLAAHSGNSTFEIIGFVNSSVWCVGSLLSLEHG